MIIADTGFFVALGNQTDRNHSAAIQFLEFLQEPLITTYPVITETCYLMEQPESIREFIVAVDLNLALKLLLPDHMPQRGHHQSNTSAHHSQHRIIAAPTEVGHPQMGQVRGH
jgi:predicted nucleic acid-binding protein